MIAVFMCSVIPCLLHMSTGTESFEERRRGGLNQGLGAGPHDQDPFIAGKQADNCAVARPGMAQSGISTPRLQRFELKNVELKNMNLKTMNIHCEEHCGAQNVGMKVKNTVVLRMRG